MVYHGEWRRPRQAVMYARTLGGDWLAEVTVQDGETVESALRRFKRKVQQEDIIKEIKRHSFYLKPGEKKRAKQALARKRNRKKQAKIIE
jgi:small subunit ribosomal protein S21